jgi:polysaccharide export outer membrane protein
MLPVVTTAIPITGYDADDTGVNMRTAALRKAWIRALLLTLWVLLAAGAELAQAQEVSLGPGDIVRVSVYGQDDLETVVRISSDGTIAFPLLGTVNVGGLTVRDAEQRIADELARRQLVRDPQVTVFVESSRAAEVESVTILGNVSRPGRYPIQAMSDAGAESVASLIALAGGLSEDAADYLVLTRIDGSDARTVKVLLRDLLERGDLSQNYVVKQGDIAFVPRMEEFFVYGEVRNPGVYRLRSGMTVIQALSASGGLTERDQDGKTRNFDVGMNDLLQPDDVLIIKEGLF